MATHIHSWEHNLLLRAEEANQRHFEGGHHRSAHDADVLARAHSACDAITAENSRSFHMASALLPWSKRQAVRALYAVCRISDDIVDESTGDVKTELMQWRAKVERGRFSAEDLVPVAWADVHHRYKVPARYMTQLIDGVARDIDQNR